MKTKIVLFLLLFACTKLAAQDQNFSKEYELSSPQKSVFTHLKFLQPETYSPKTAAKALYNDGSLKSEEMERRAVLLKRIFDGLGIFIRIDLIPDEANHTDTLGGEIRKFYLVDKSQPDIYLIKKGSRWLYSAETVKRIPDIYDEVYPLGTGILPDITAGFEQKTYLGLYPWQYAGILIILLACFLLYRIQAFIVHKLISRFFKHIGFESVTKHFLLPVAKPVSLVFVVIFLTMTFRLLQIPVLAASYITLTFNILLPFFMTMVCYRLADVLGYFFVKLASRTENTLDDQIVPLVRKIMKVVVVLIGSLFILQNAGFEITGLLTGISIGGLAFALAAQDTLKNFFGSLMIFIDKPFQIGDWIVGTGIDGSVEEVGFRSTRIRTFHNSVISIPNGSLAGMTIDNMGLRTYRRFSTIIALTYDTPPDLIEAFAEGLRQIILNHPDTRKDYYVVNFSGMADFSLNITFYTFFAVPDWSAEMKAKQEVLLDILRLAETTGVRFAFPTQTLHMEEFPEKQSGTPIYTDSPAEFREKVRRFFADKPAQN